MSRRVQNGVSGCRTCAGSSTLQGQCSSCDLVWARRRAKRDNLRADTSGLWGGGPEREPQTTREIQVLIPNDNEELLDLMSEASVSRLNPGEQDPLPQRTGFRLTDVAHLERALYECGMGCPECGDALEMSRAVGTYCCYACWAWHQYDERGYSAIWKLWYEFTTTHGDPDHPENREREYTEAEAEAHILEVTGSSWVELQRDELARLVVRLCKRGLGPPK